ncbi:hypothetical protein ACROYT_G028634 [Oculina patagonica]
MLRHEVLPQLHRIQADDKLLQLPESPRIQTHTPVPSTNGVGETSPPDKALGDALDKVTAEKIDRTDETEKEKLDEDGRMLVLTNDVETIDGEGVSVAEDA